MTDSTVVSVGVVVMTDIGIRHGSLGGDGSPAGWSSGRATPPAPSRAASVRRRHCDLRRGARSAVRSEFHDSFIFLEGIVHVDVTECSDVSPQLTPLRRTFSARSTPTVRFDRRTAKFITQRRSTMPHTIRSHMPFGLLALGCLTLSAPVQADVSCPPNRGAVTIDDNVVVRGICSLNGTSVKGNVLVYSGGRLTATNVRVDGNIQAEGAGSVAVRNSAIDGDIQLKGVRGSASYIIGNRVNGNIQMERNTRFLDVQSNVVDGDIQAFSNTGRVNIRSNVVDGNLQCKSNRPAPTGGANRVSGNKEDQCRRL
jgi:hypothetical protein